MSSQKSKADLVRRITRALPKGRATPDHDEIDDLLNEAIGIISDRIGPLETSWNNDPGGDLTLSGYTFALPTDCVEPQSVEWDGVPLTKADRATFDVMDDQWRDTTGTPTYWFADGVNGYLDADYGSAATGLLVLRGIGMIPEFPANDAASPNPLAYFPAGFEFQLLCAEYAIATLPVEVVEPTSDKPEALRHADLLTKLRMDASARAAQRWEKGLVALADAYAKRSMDVWRF